MDVNKKNTLFSRIKAILMDIDGVLTDGKIIYDQTGNELKQFNAQDGLGIVLALRLGIKIFFITSRSSPIVQKRAEELGIDLCVQNVKNKSEAVQQISHEYGISLENMIFIGDDLVDLSAMGIVGTPVAVSNAVDEVKESALLTTRKAGGEGAVREVIEEVLKSQNLWERVISSYTKR